MTQNMNNLSRNLFKKFLEQNPDISRVDSRNVFQHRGTRYAFSVTGGTEIVCRQFYDDCAALVCYNVETDKTYQLNENELYIDNLPNRITTKGIKAYTAKTDAMYAKTSQFTLKV